MKPITPPRATQRLGRFLSFCGNPIVVSAPCLAAVSCRATPRWPDRLRWWCLATAAISVTPFVHVRYGVRSGRLSDHEVSVRRERFWPYAGEIGAALLSYGVMRALGAPREMTALVLAVAGAMVAVTGVTLLWKVSMHATGTAGAVTVLVLLYGRRLLPLAVIVPLVGWSRCALGRHTPAQVVAGAAIGVAAPVLVFRAMGL